MRRAMWRAGLLACLAGCGFGRTEFGGHSYTEQHGVLVVDGVSLPNKRWVPVEVPVGTGSLELGSATSDIVLAGSPDGASHLEVQLFSEVEGDGTVKVDGGKLVTASAAGRMVIPNGLRGTLARGMQLAIDTGTGELRLEGLPDLTSLRLGSGTGELRLTQCSGGDVRIESGTGDVHIEGLKAGKLQIDTGTGSAQLAACTLSAIKISTGTGDVTLSDCNSGRTDVESGTGNVVLEGQNELGAATYDLGTGKVKTR